MLLDLRLGIRANTSDKPSKMARASSTLFKSVPLVEKVFLLKRQVALGL